MHTYIYVLCTHIHLKLRKEEICGSENRRYKESGSSDIFKCLFANVRKSIIVGMAETAELELYAVNEGTDLSGIAESFMDKACRSHRL